MHWSGRKATNCGGSCPYRHLHFRHRVRGPFGGWTGPGCIFAQNIIFFSEHYFFSFFLILFLRLIFPFLLVESSFFFPNHPKPYIFRYDLLMILFLGSHIRNGGRWSLLFPTWPHLLLRQGIYVTGCWYPVKPDTGYPVENCTGYWISGKCMNFIIQNAFSYMTP